MNTFAACRSVIVLGMVLWMAGGEVVWGVDTARERQRVDMVRTEAGYALLRGGEPYFIKGAGGDEHLDVLVERGGNSIRTWGARDLEPLLDRAHAKGLTVTVGIWLGHERHGFDYTDEARVQQQFEQAREYVRQYRDHPALLIWAIGNEMEGTGENPLIWRAVNDIARMIKEEDPHHPTMTVIAEASETKVRQFLEHCPDVDILGVNTYGGLASLPERLLERGYEGPYIVTEFGPRGPWESPRTSWEAEYEQTSSEKAAMYLANYRRSIAGQRDRCLGSYVFKWGQKQEATATWFSMFLETGEPLNAVDAMTYAWRGRWPANRSPEVGGIELDADYTDMPVGQSFTAAVQAEDPDGDPLTFIWEIVAEATDRRAGGDREHAPPTIHRSRRTEQTRYRFPGLEEAGHYRVFVWVFDDQGNAATANLPFRVRP